jgi:hypothetical protein
MLEVTNSEPFAGDVLIENQYGQRQQQANSAKQRDRDECIDVGDRYRRRAREEPCNCCGHVILQILRGAMALNVCLKQRNYVQPPCINIWFHDRGTGGKSAGVFPVATARTGFLWVSLLPPSGPNSVLKISSHPVLLSRSLLDQE